MRPKNTYKILGPIETNIVARLTYEKKVIVTAEDMDQLFNLSRMIENKLILGSKEKNNLTNKTRPMFFRLLRQGLREWV